MKRAGDPADLGILIAVLRSIPHWTQGELAQAAGVDRASISDYERGLKAPSRRTLEKIVAAVGVPFARVERLLPILRSLRLSREEAAGATEGSPAAAPAFDLPAALSRAATEIAAAELAAVFLEIPAFSGALRDDAASPLAIVVDRLREESAKMEVDGTERSLEAAALARRVAELFSQGREGR